MRWVVLILLAGCSVAPRKPVIAPAPSPVEVKPFKRMAMRTATANAVARQIRFYWEWVPGPTGNTESNCVFNIFSTPDLTKPRNSWAFKASFPGTVRSFVVYPTNDTEFFEVNVSNQQTHLVSAWTKMKM